jgi:flagellar biosynthesis protein FlhA
MAIDADLSAGLIDQDEARRRRTALEDEASFFGAMDGASKFVRGDAIAGILITFINVIGGILIGVVQRGMSFSSAATTYTMLSVGDGLVSQIPALIVSTAAGLLVSKAGVRGAADKALMRQMSGYPKALGMSAAVMGMMAILPGIPFIPFATLAAGAAYLAWKFEKVNKGAASEKAAARSMQEAGAPGAPGSVDASREETMADILKMDDLKIEIGYGLLPLVNGSLGEDRLTEQVKALRRQLAGEFGFVMPSVRIVDNVALEASVYIIKVKEIDAGTGIVYPNQFMCMDPMGGQVDLPGQHVLEPTFGLPATWIDNALRDEAQLRGYTVVDAASVISTHLTEVLKANMPELLSHVETQKLLKELPKEHADLVKDIVPSLISTTGIQRVLQLLLAERVSIRDLPAILEGVSEATSHTRNITAITEHVRTRLARQLCEQNAAEGGVVPLVTLGPEWEQSFAESIVGQGEERQLSMPPSRLQEFIQMVRSVFEHHSVMGENPVLLTSPLARPFVRSIVERFRPATTVMSQNEIHPKARIKTVGTI